MHDETENQKEMMVPNFSTIVYLDMDLSNNIIFAARIRSVPFSVIAFEYYEMKSHDFSSGDDLDGVGWLLQHVTRWRELDSGAKVLVPEGVTMLPWSQMFMCFARRIGKGSTSKEIISMCGPFSDRYYLTPIDKSILLYKLGPEDKIKEKLIQMPVDRSAVDSVPFKDLWDWQTALIVTHLYCWGKMEQGYESSGREIITF